MAEKQIKTRIINKHDTEANWIKATNFIPKQGELVVYDKDSTHSYERFKIGDGSTKINDLSFSITPDPSKVSNAHTTDEYITAVNTSGEYHKWTISKDLKAEQVIVSRTASGNINVPDTPGNSNSAICQKYVDNKFVSGIYEANLKWGGKNISGDYAPIDAAMIPELGANRLAFMPAAAIDIEYSRDGGTTWANYTTTDSHKIQLFNGQMDEFIIGADTSKGIDKSKYMVRFTINTGAAKVYTVLNKFAIYITSGGSGGCYCTITGRLQSHVESNTETWKTFIDKAPISGYSGWNILNTANITTYSNNKPHQYGQVRFTFGVTSHTSSSSSSGLRIHKILGFGGVGWITPSKLAANGRMYTWDANQSVYFPGAIYANNNKKVALEESVPGVNNKALGFKYINDSSDTTIILDAGTSTTVI